MWIGKIEELKDCKAISVKDAETIARFIAENDMSTLPIGKYALGGENFVNVIEYETKESDGIFEAHEKYVDIQYVIIGEEKILWAEKIDSETTPYKSDKDRSLGLVNEPEQSVLSNGTLCVFVPKEAHKVGLTLSAITNVKKAVFKIASC